MAYCDCNHITPCKVTPQPCKIDSCKDCIRVASPVIMPRDSVGCSQSGTLNLKPLNNYSICTGEMFHKIVRYDKDIFENVFIDDTGGKLELNFTLTSGAKPWNFYPIYYKAVCIDSGKGNFGIVQVGVKDLCEFKDCNNCNPCTGECIQGVVDASVSIGGTDIKVEL
jgi:hypothetical protein